MEPEEEPDGAAVREVYEEVRRRGVCSLGEVHKQGSVLECAPRERREDSAVWLSHSTF